MALKYDKFKFFGMLLLKNVYYIVSDKVTFPLRSNSERKIGFFSGHSMSLTSKTNTH